MISTDVEQDQALLRRIRRVEGDLASLSEQFDVLRNTRLTQRDVGWNAIGTQELQVDSILARHILAGTITADKLDVDELSAISADLGTVTAGDITLDTAGFIRGGATAYNTGTGFWMGYDTSAYKFFIGTAAGNKLTWDGTALSIVGSITASSGTIGGFDIGADYIRDVANSMGLASTVTGGDDVRFWAGDTFANRASAPFRVTEAGNITAANATITGTISGRSTATIASTINAAGNVITDLINARLDSSAKTMLSDFTFGSSDYAGALKSGTITWNTTTGAITGGSGVLVYRGGIVGAASGVATFTLDAATGNATFAGALSAPTGTIGGWTIGITTLSGTNTTLSSAGTLTLGTGNDVVLLSATDATYRLWVGNATAGSASFSVNKSGSLFATGANVSGTLTTTSASIGGFDVGADYFRDVANSFGLASTVTGGDDVRFWAGSTFANRASAPFRLTEAGVLNASSATISGTITSSSGTIGGFTIGSTTLSAGSGDNAISIDSAGTIVLGNATFGANDAAVVGSGFLNVYGYSPNYFAKLSGLNGKLIMGTWTYAGSYSEATVVQINGTNGDYDSYGGVMKLYTSAAGLRVTLDGTNGDGTFTGVVRANDKFNHNGTDGASGFFDPNTITSITVSGGIITAWS